MGIVINFDEYADTGTYWIVLFCTEIEVIDFDSFGVEHVPKELKNLLSKKTQKQTYLEYNQTIQYFIDFMFAGKTLIDYTSLFSPYDFEKNDSIILKYFKDK